MGLSKKIAANTIYQVIGRVLTTLLALVIVVYLTRYLGVAGYGQYTTIIAYLGVFTILADFGFYMIASREISQNPHHREKIFNNTLTIRIASGLGLMLIANLVAFLMPYPAIVKAGIWIFSIGILAMLINQVIIVLFQINLTTIKIALGDVLGRALTLALVILAINRGADLKMIMWVSSGGFILTLFISLGFVWNYLKIRLAFDFPFWKKMLIEAWPIGVVIVLLSLYFRINTVFLSILPLDHSLISSVNGLSNNEATGLYGPPYRIMDTIQIFPAIVMGIILPIFSRLLIEKKNQAKVLLDKTLEVLIIAGIGIAFSLMAVSPQIILLIGGSGFERSVIIIQILGFATAAFFVIVGINYFIVAMGKQKRLIKPYIYTLVLNLAIGVVGVYFFSYIGAAVATLIVNIMLMVFGLNLLNRVGYRFNFKIAGKILFSGLIMSIVMFYFNKINLIEFGNLNLVIQALWILGLIGISILIYFTVLHLTKTFSFKDLKIFEKEV